MTVQTLGPSTLSHGQSTKFYARKVTQRRYDFSVRDVNLARMPAIKAKLLIVDDEPVIVEIITKLLCHAFDTRNAYDGEEAVSIAKEFHPDCVVTGCIMPRMDGLQEAAAILQFQPSCKFVFVTSNAHDPTIRQEYERLGLDLKLLLPKPFQRVDLLNALALVGFPCS